MIAIQPIKLLRMDISEDEQTAENNEVDAISSDCVDNPIASYSIQELPDISSQVGSSEGGSPNSTGDSEPSEEQDTADMEDTSKEIDSSLSPDASSDPINPSDDEYEDILDEPSPEDSSASAEMQNTDPTSNKLEALKKPVYFYFRMHGYNKEVNSTYKCHVCNGQYKQKFSLKRHFLRNHINPKYISPADISNCKIKIRNKLNAEDGTEENKSVSGRKKFKASGAIFLENNKSKLMVGLYKCHTCRELKFDQESDLKVHYLTHLNEEKENFSCELCNAVFSKKISLSKHMTTHGEKKGSFKCNRCKLEFCSNSDYAIHMSTHGSGKICKYCSKEFSTPANRKRHENLHEGGQGFSCKHCLAVFPDNSSLEKHIKKKHANLYLICPLCPKLGIPKVFSSQFLLTSHMNEKHDGAMKKSDHLNSVKQSNGKGRPSFTVPSHNKSVCCYCKQKFSDLRSMLKHKSVAHKKVLHKHKNVTPKKSVLHKPSLVSKTNDLKVVANSVIDKDDKKILHKHKNASEKKKIFHKRRTTYKRKAKQPLKNKVAKEKIVPKKITYSYTRKEVNEFYGNLPQNIADNLLHYVDGRINKPPIKEYIFNDESVERRAYRDRIPWSDYNFPLEFDVDQALDRRGQEIKQIPEGEQCLYATGLERINSPPEGNSDALDSKTVFPSQQNVNNNTQLQLHLPANDKKSSPLTLEEKMKLIQHEVSVICICSVCKEKFPSSLAFEEHCINNHPNIEVSCLEIESDKDLQPIIPYDLSRPLCLKPDGVLFSWSVPPSVLGTSTVTCTKCHSAFSNSSDLHVHILSCGGKDTFNLHSQFRKKPNQQKRIKHTMKHRMDLSVKQVRCKNDKERQIFKTGYIRKAKFKCGKDYFATKSCKTMKRKPLLPYKSKPTSQPATCFYCKKSFKTKLELQEHYSICPKCNPKKKSKKNSKVTHSVTKKKINAFKASEKSNVCVTALPNKLGKNSDSSRPSSSRISTLGAVQSKTCDLYSQNLRTKKTNNATSQAEASGSGNGLSTSSSSISGNNCSAPADQNTLNSAMDLTFKTSNNSIASVPAASKLKPEGLGLSNHATPLETLQKIIQRIALKPVDQDRKISKGKTACQISKTPEVNGVAKTENVTSQAPLLKQNLPKIKEVVKEIKLSKASNSPKIKTYSAQSIFTFLKTVPKDSLIHTSHVVNNSPENKITDTGVKETSITVQDNESTRRKRKKGKPIKIVQKSNNLDNSNAIKEAVIWSFQGEKEDIDSQKLLQKPVVDSVPNASEPNMSENKNSENKTDKVSTIALEENNQVKNVSVEIPTHSCNDVDTVNPTECLPEVSEEISSVHSPCCSTSSKIIIDPLQKAGELSSLFLPADQVTAEFSNADVTGRESPTLENLVSSVTQNIEGFDDQDDEKFVLSSPILPGTPTKNCDSVANESSNSGLNFQIIIPRNEKQQGTPLNGSDLSPGTSSEPCSSSSIIEPSTLLSTDAISSNLDKPEQSLENQVPNAIQDTLETSETKLVDINGNSDTNNKIDDQSSLNEAENSINDSGTLSSDKQNQDNSVPNSSDAICTSSCSSLEQSATVRKIGNQPTSIDQNSTQDIVSKKTGEKNNTLASAGVTEMSGAISNEGTSAEKNGAAKDQHGVSLSAKKLKCKKNAMLADVTHSNQESLSNQECKTSGTLAEKTYDKVTADKTDDKVNADKTDDKVNADKTDDKVNAYKTDDKNGSSKRKRRESLTVQPAKRRSTSDLSKTKKQSQNSESKKTQVPRKSKKSPDELLETAPKNPPDQVDKPDGNLSSNKSAQLRAFRIKNSSTAEENLSQADNSTVNNEFAKNLTNKMKEKIRMSFGNTVSQNASNVKSLTSLAVQDGHQNSTPLTLNQNDSKTNCSDPVHSNNASLLHDSSTEHPESNIKEESDCNEEDCVKREFESHTCPYCFLEFSYLTNFRRHLKSCASKPASISIEDSSPAPSTSRLQHLPKKDEVEGSMLQLIRNQSRQSQMIKEATKDPEIPSVNVPETEKKFQKFVCEDCHKIYFSLFKMMQHRMKDHLMPNSDSRGMVPDNQQATESAEDAFFEEQNVQTISNAVGGIDVEEPMDEDGSVGGFVCSADCTEGALDEDGVIKAKVKDSKSNKKATKRNKSREGKSSQMSVDSANRSEIGSSEHKNIENSLNTAESNPEDKSLMAVSSSKKEDTVVKNKYKELLDPSFLVLPSYGKGRGRKKRDIVDNADKVTEDENKSGAASKSKKTKRGINKMKSNSKMSTLKMQTKKKVFRKLNPAPKESIKKLAKVVTRKIRGNYLASVPQKGENSSFHELNKRSRKAKLRAKIKVEDKSETDSIFSDSDVPLNRKSDDKTNEDMHSAFESDHVLTVMKNVPSQSTSASSENSASKRRRKNAQNSDLIPNLNIPKGKKVKFNDDELSAFASSPIDSHNAINFSSDLNIVKEKTNSSKSLPSPKAGTVKVIKLKSETILSDVESVSPTKVPCVKGNKTKKISNSIDGAEASMSQNKSKLSKSTKPAALLIDYYKIESSPTSPINDKMKSLKGIKPIPRTICDIQSGPSISAAGSTTANFKVTTFVMEDDSETDDASDFKQEPPRKKVCPICKKRFPGTLLRNKHVQLVHGRKNNRTEVDSVKDEKEYNIHSDSPKSRSSQRQCIKPLPPMKRRYQKTPALSDFKKRKL